VAALAPILALSACFGGDPGGSVHILNGGARPFPTLAVVAIFAATYLVVAIGRLPGFRLDRAGAALLGASLMVGVGALDLRQAYKAIDFDTITLLLGTMIVVANLRLSGFFGVINNWVATRARHPFMLLAALTLVTGFFSAFLVNDTICLVMTPLVLDLVGRLKRNPVPYLLAVAMASNVGSTATITGNPQNMIIGSVSGLPYVTFAAALAPIAATGLLVTTALIALVYRAEFLNGERLYAAPHPTRSNRPLVLKSVFVAAAMIVLFFVGQPPAKVAIVAGGLLLLTRRIKAHRIYREIDWPLLVMFAGLFIVVAALEQAVLSPGAGGILAHFHLDDTAVLSGLTAALSNLVSNVPAVLVLKPFVERLSDQQHAWLVVAMASTLAGNFTIVGSVANLIVVQRARANGLEIRFWDYFKVGAPVTVATIAIGVLML
jgi:Na+/H+ antiporter NhaD/arsenite permease-like protein